MIGHVLKHLSRSTTLWLQQGTYWLNPQLWGSSQPAAGAVAAGARRASPHWKARSRQAPLRRSWKRLQERHMSGAAGQLVPLRWSTSAGPGGAERWGLSLVRLQCPLPSGFAAPQPGCGRGVFCGELMFELKPVSPSLAEQDRPGARGARWSQPSLPAPCRKPDGRDFSHLAAAMHFFCLILFISLSRQNSSSVILTRGEQTQSYLPERRVMCGGPD